MSETVISADRDRKEPPTGVRVLLHILSVLLCLCLCVSLLATTAILDFRLITAQDTVRRVANSMLMVPAQSRRIPMTAAVGGLSAASPSGSNAPAQVELVNWVYDTLQEQHGEELLVTREQMQAFVDQSPTKEYLTDKIASYMTDFINGTNTTTITTEELDWLIEENNAAIEAQLGVKIDDAARQQVLSFAEEMNISELIRTEVIDKLEDVTISGTSSPLPGEADDRFTVSDLMAQLRSLSSTTILIISIAVIVLLIVALFFTNRMRLSGTLCCVGIPAAVMGGLLTIATCVLQFVPGLMPNSIGNILSILVSTIAPVHYAILGLGIAALIGAIVANALRKK